MKRKIIYTLYETGESAWGFLLLFGIAWILGLAAVALMKMMGVYGPLAIFFWSGLNCFAFFKFGQVGAKIYMEKKQFEHWRVILSRDDTTPVQKERVAWKILNSVDVNEDALKDLFFHFPHNEKMVNSILDRCRELKLQSPVEENKN